MTEPFLYTCKYEYCNNEFEPRRRGAQKFCSATCRSKHWHLNNSLNAPTPTLTSTPAPSQNELIAKPIETKPEKKKKKKKKKPTKIEKISPAGIGNAALGTLAVNTLTKLLTKEKDKLVTNGDLAKVISHLERYQPIENLPVNEFSQKPYFDMDTKSVVYRGYNPFSN